MTQQIMQNRSRRVYGAGRVRCGCCGAFVWVFQYIKGEYTYEGDFGEPHRTFRPMVGEEKRWNR